jgi:hypothetical protein
VVLADAEDVQAGIVGHTSPFEEIVQPLTR